MFYVCSYFRVATEARVALQYRVVAFGQPRGPWRAKQKEAERDAIGAGLAEVDEWGQLYLDGCAAIEWAHAPEIRLSA